MRIGHASIDERGKAKSGAAGDQTGKEVCIRSWYSRPWDYVLRCVDPVKADMMAKACEDGCANNHIGYDQNQRNSLRTQAKLCGMDLSRISVDCETDCSAFMAVCAECAGIAIPYNGGNAPTTSTMRNAFVKSGAFKVLTESKYTTSDKYLRRGDILVKAGSHTVMALDNGVNSTVATTTLQNETVKAPTLNIGSTHPEVLNVQKYLALRGYQVGEIDGIYGPQTSSCVRQYQVDWNLTHDGKIAVDGIWGKQCWSTVGILS